ncbi:hypothetical protein [Salegentibacter maritimus]|uniref:Uncharacterized protein n=1 Tax=Salegentibacter maritimus TaxID=2794347 RepID=A0ABS0THP0_9FLAO|nr:hypothetical protein [Salegentibacter maritimus]MBI6119756.1 hypothetical protein [Salegentibacter maritimus]
MKLFLKRISFFIVLISVLYVPGLLLIDLMLPPIYKPNVLYQAGNGLVQKKIEESDTLSDIDVLFLGSSHAYNTFDPLIFETENITSYNWGTSQQTHPQTQMVLKEYLLKLKPKLVVYEVFPEMFAMSGRASTADFLNASKPFEVGLSEIFEYENSIVLLNTYLVKYARKFLDIEDKKQNFSSSSRYYRGYLERPYLATSIRDDIQIRWVPRENQLTAFEENLKFLKENKIPYILVIAPYAFSYKNTFDVEEYLERQGELYDYNKLIKFDTSKDFNDVHHINHYGATKVNLHLKQILKNKLEKLNFF